MLKLTGCTYLHVPIFNPIMKSGVQRIFHHLFTSRTNYVSQHFNFVWILETTKKKLSEPNWIFSSESKKDFSLTFRPDFRPMLGSDSTNRFYKVKTEFYNELTKTEKRVLLGANPAITSYNASVVKFTTQLIA
jgi:hypothetical protein